jgi:hypothetical protein
MNKIFFYSIVLGSLTLSGCSKFLEKDPDSNRAVINNPEQVSQLLISAYPKGSYITITEAFSDNADDKSQGTDDVTNRDCYKFAEVNSSPDNQDSPQLYWAECYKAIAAANQALDIIKDAPNQDLFKSQKGEALIARAYAHFMLVNLFSQFYDPATAGSDLGIPYVDESESVVIKKYERKTVAYVYERIEKDIAEGLPLIEDKYYDVPKYHFTRAAANAFASRFFLYKKDYDKVLLHTNAVYPANNIADQLRPWNTTWNAYAYQELWTNFSKASTVSNLLLVETSSVYGRYSYSYRYAYTNEILNKNWAVKAVCGNPTWTFQNKIYTVGTGNYLIPKLSEYFKSESINANYGQPYVMVPLFDAEEVLFNRAEANVYKGNFDLALADLNVYVSRRAANYNATNHAVTNERVLAYGASLNQTEAYIKVILDLRRMEYVMQGMRWFDMQRYKMPVTHVLKSSSGTILETITLPAGDNRRVLQIPTSATLSGLELNPR